MDTFYIICGVVVAALLLGFILLPIAKSKGWISKKIAIGVAEGVDTGVDVVQAIINAIGRKSVVLTSVNAVLDIADIATDYVVALLDTDTDDQKITLTLKAIELVLKEVGISPTDSQQNLINIVVEQGVEFLVGEDKLT